MYHIHTKITGLRMCCGLRGSRVSTFVWSSPRVVLDSPGTFGKCLRITLVPVLIGNARETVGHSPSNLRYEYEPPESLGEHAVGSLSISVKVPYVSLLLQLQSAFTLDTRAGYVLLCSRPCILTHYIKRYWTRHGSRVIITPLDSP